MIERYTLAMFYRLPPKFSLDLTYLNLEFLSFAPLVSCALTFWAIGNQ